MSEDMQLRRFELGLPHFSGLDLGTLFAGMDNLHKGNLENLSTFIKVLGEAGKLRTIRKLAAIWNATDLELQLAETDAKVMAKLEEKQAEKSFKSSFEAALNFQLGLFAVLGVSPASSTAKETQTETPAGEVTPEGSPSVG